MGQNELFFDFAWDVISFLFAVVIVLFIWPFGVYDDLVNSKAKIKRKHHQSMLDSGYVLCPECGGEGECEYERPVVDWNNGGYLEGYMDTCDTCEGEGYINE